MKAAFKWRIENGLYAYLTDEENNGPFSYNLLTHERLYDDGTVVASSAVTEPDISTLVSRMSKQEYINAFNRFKTFVNENYPQTTLLDVIYYYNMESDECTISASSPKCVTDLILDATVKTGNTLSVTVINEKTGLTSDEELRYKIDFVLPIDGATHRAVNVNGEEFLSLDDKTTPLNLSAGTLVTLTTGQTGTVTINADVPTERNELIYSDDGDVLTTHQLLYQEAVIVDNYDDYTLCTSVDNIERDILGSWHQFVCDDKYSPEYATGLYVSGSTQYPNTGYAMWYTDQDGKVLNKVNSGDFNGYMIPKDKTSYIIESLIGTNTGGTSGDQIGFSIINDSTAVPRRILTENGIYLRNTMYDKYRSDDPNDPDDPDYDISGDNPKRPKLSAWVMEDDINNTAKVIYTKSPTEIGDDEDNEMPNTGDTVEVYRISNTNTTKGRRSCVYDRDETVVDIYDAAGYIGMITVVVANSTDLQMIQSGGTHIGTIYVFGSIYDVKRKAWTNKTIINGDNNGALDNSNIRNTGVYYDKGGWLVGYNDGLNTTTIGNSAIIKTYVEFKDGVLTMRFADPITFNNSENTGYTYNGSELVINFKTHTYDFTPYSGATRDGEVLTKKSNISLGSFICNVKDKNDVTVSQNVWDMFVGGTKFGYNAYSYANLYIKCINYILDNYVFYVNKNSLMYGVYELNAERTSYVKRYLEGGVADDPMNYFSGSRMNYNPITRKLFYNDGSSIYQVANTSNLPGNNVTGNGTTGHLAKWVGENEIGDGPKLGSSTSTYLRNDGTWATPSQRTIKVDNQTLNNSTTLNLSAGTNVTLTKDDTSGTVVIEAAGGSSTDQKVRQTSGNADDTYPLLASNQTTSTISSGGDYEAIYDTGIKINPNKHSVASGYEYNQNSTINATASGSHAEGTSLGISGPCSINATGSGSHAEGYANQANSHINAASGGSHAEGYVSSGEANSSGNGSHTEGYVFKGSINATSGGSHAEGFVFSGTTTASGIGSHAEGCASGGTITASGTGSHAEGINTFAYGNSSHAEGEGEKSYISKKVYYQYTNNPNMIRCSGDTTGMSDDYSNIKVGDIIKYNSLCAKCIGVDMNVSSEPHLDFYLDTDVSGLSSAIIEKIYEGAIGNNSHVSGKNTIAYGDNQTVVGKHNIPWDKDALFIIGSGENNENRENSFVVTDFTVSILGSAYTVESSSAPIYTWSGTDFDFMCIKPKINRGTANAWLTYPTNHHTMIVVSECTNPGVCDQRIFAFPSDKYIPGEEITLICDSSYNPANANAYLLTGPSEISNNVQNYCCISELIYNNILKIRFSKETFNLTFGGNTKTFRSIDICENVSSNVSGIYLSKNITGNNYYATGFSSIISIAFNDTNIYYIDFQ